jgi:hypothetical protein
MVVVVVLLLALLPQTSWGMEATEAKRLMAHYGKVFDVEPATLAAVAHVESGKGGQEFRFGRVGEVYLPMGIHECFRYRWNIEDPEVNIMVGARALRSVGSSDMRLKSRLRSYNKEFNHAYWVDVLAARGRYRAYYRKVMP